MVSNVTKAPYAPLLWMETSNEVKSRDKRTKNDFSIVVDARNFRWFYLETEGDQIEL